MNPLFLFGEKCQAYPKIRLPEKNGKGFLGSLLLLLVLCLFTNPADGAAPKKAVQATTPSANATQPAAQSPANAAEPAPQPLWPAGKAGDAARAYSAKNYDMARKLWEELAMAGDAEAMNNLGILYDQGLGVDPDTGRAVHWFAESANAGNPAGMSNYGRMLERGRGVPANPEEAARWFDAAARKGQPEAQYNLGYLYEHGRGVAKDDASAAAWYSRAGSSGQKDALARLGHFFRIGKGVPQDMERATLLLYAAAMEGSKPAIEELEELARENPPKASASLFGQKLDDTGRAAMRDSLKKAGAVATRESDEHICDVYEPGKTVPGASNMAVCYGPGSKLGFLKIDYPAPDKNRADAVLKMVESRFGEATAGEGDASRLWNLGSVIVATQYAPDHKLISLMYMVPRVYHLTR